MGDTTGETQVADGMREREESIQDFGTLGAQCVTCGVQGYEINFKTYIGSTALSLTAEALALALSDVEGVITADVAEFTIHFRLDHTRLSTEVLDEVAELAKVALRENAQVILHTTRQLGQPDKLRVFLVLGRQRSKAQLVELTERVKQVNGVYDAISDDPYTLVFSLVTGFDTKPRATVVAHDVALTLGLYVESLREESSSRSNLSTEGGWMEQEQPLWRQFANPTR